MRENLHQLLIPRRIVEVEHPGGTLLIIEEYHL
jgi:hypothetical protein